MEGTRGVTVGTGRHRLLTQDEEPGSTTLIDSHNGFNDIS